MNHPGASKENTDFRMNLNLRVFTSGLVQEASCGRGREKTVPSIRVLRRNFGRGRCQQMDGMRTLGRLLVALRVCWKIYTVGSFFEFLLIPSGCRRVVVFAIDFFSCAIRYRCVCSFYYYWFVFCVRAFVALAAGRYLSEEDYQQVLVLTTVCVTREMGLLCECCHEGADCGYTYPRTVGTPT